MGMNPDIKNKWVSRLESGQDEQGAGYLNRDNKLCCLGVLCEIAVEEGVAEKYTRTILGQECAFYRAKGGPVWSGDSGVLPSVVAEWAGIEGDDNINPTVLGYQRLSDLNDEYKMTLKQIALVIDDKL